MAKTLIPGQTVTTPYGDVWNTAILVVDDIQLNYKDQIMRMAVNIYKDSTARSENKRAYSEVHFVGSDEFLANIVVTDPINTLKAQAEDYALTLESSRIGPYGSLFE